MVRPSVCAGLGVWLWTAGVAGPAALAGDRSSPSDRVLLLKTGTVDTRTLSNLTVEAPMALGSGRWHIVQLDRPMDAMMRSDLAKLGVRLRQYVPRHAYQVRLRDGDRERLLTLPYVAWIGPYRKEWKIDPTIRRRMAALQPAAKPAPLDSTPVDKQVEPYQTSHRLALARNGKAQVVVTLFDDEDVETAAAALRDVPGASVLTVTRAGGRAAIDAIVRVGSLDAVAEIASVQFTSDAPEGTLRNDTTRWVIQSGISNETPLWDHGLHGENEIVGLIDSPIDVDHCSFYDDVPVGAGHRKIVAVRGTGSPDSHGTHVAGILAGDAGTYGQYDYHDGMAFGARISFSRSSDVDASPSTLYPRLLDAHSNGARVHSNSWGDDNTTDYTTWSQQIDAFSWDHETDLVVFAVTNLSTLKSPENAKNVLAVGATSQYPNHNNHCLGGSGPTSDGRRKPEVYAPGCGIYSSRYNTSCGWWGQSGTSMAAPAVAGMAILARQYFTDGFYPTGAAEADDRFVPSGALLKASVINATVEMTGSPSGYPNDTEGWGRIVMDNALYFDGDDGKLFAVDVFNTSGLSTDESDAYHVRVLDDTQPLRMTLVWTDPPSAIGAMGSLINDLNLIVTAPGSSDVYYGNEFAGGESAPFGTKDTVNNVERVIRNTPDIGTYTIEIEGFAVNQDTQGYALVVNGDIFPCPSAPYNDLDLADFADFQRCFGAGMIGGITPECFVHDSDCDDDVDLDDFATFSTLLTGPS